MSRLGLLFAGTVLAAAVLSAGSVVFDPSGRVQAMFYGGDELAVRTNIVVPSPGWTRQATVPAGDEVRTTKTDTSTTWQGSLAIGPGQTLAFRQTATQRDGRTVITLEYTAPAEFPAEGIYWRIDLPRESFANGEVEFTNPPRSAALPARKERVDLIGGTTASMNVRDAESNVRWSVNVDRPVFINLQDKEESNPPIFTAWLYLHRGNVPAGLTGRYEFELAVSGEPDSKPAQITLNMSERRYRLRGFGGNYCFNIESPVTQYTLDNLRVAWARTEMTLTEWEPVNDNDSPTATDFAVLAGRDTPDSNLRREFLLARQIQDRGIPYVISIWRLPEWLYTDPNQKGPSDQRRRVNPALWDELLESIGSYLLYARDRYGVEPDLFSFNEANIGVYVLFSAEEHRDAIKRIGAHLESLGLKTRMLLADATGARGTHTYALPASEDAEAMRYVGAIAFHSWGGATPEQYGAWGDLAERLRLPLLVTELGYDAAGWRGRAYDSYWYGMREVQMYQEILLYARPQGTMYWEFTSDYGLVNTTAQKGSVFLQPTERFWFTKQFTDLTPPDGWAVAASSDRAKVLVTAFSDEAVVTVHVANLAAAREVRIDGLPFTMQRLAVTLTREGEGFAAREDVEVREGSARLSIPERCLVTLAGRLQP